MKEQTENEAMPGTLQLMDLPNELLIKILNKVKSNSLEDLNSTSLCNKRLLQLTLDHVVPKKLYFKLVGFTKNHFVVGLNICLNSTIYTHDHLEIGNYDLRLCLDSLDDNILLLNKPCHSIRSMKITACLITPRSFWLLLRLFPNLEHLHLSRNIYTFNQEDFQYACQYKQIECLKLTLPILSKHSSFLSWLLKQFKAIKLLHFISIDGLISKKRHHFRHFKESIDEWICNMRNLKEILEAEKAKMSFVDCKLTTKRHHCDIDELEFSLEQFEDAPMPAIVIGRAQIRQHFDHMENVNFDFGGGGDFPDDIDDFDDGGHFPDDDIEDFRIDPDVDQGPFDFD